MKIINNFRQGDYGPDILKDSEGMRGLRNTAIDLAERAIDEAIDSFIAATEKCSILKPKGENVALKVTVEFGDTNDIEYETDD